MADLDIFCHLYLTGRSSEYTEVPLDALDIAAADSLTLSPHHGMLYLTSLCHCNFIYFFILFNHFLILVFRRQ